MSVDGMIKEDGKLTKRSIEWQRKSRYDYGFKGPTGILSFSSLAQFPKGTRLVIKSVTDLLW